MLQQRFDAAVLPDPGVTLPLNFRDLASHDINFERSEAANAALPSLHGNFVMSGRHQSPEMSLVVGGKRCHLALFVFNSKSGIRERF